LDNVSGLREDAGRGDALFGNMDTFLIWHLTGGGDGGTHVTDVTSAGRTQLMNLQTLVWDDELSSVFEILRLMLPAIKSSSEFYGNVMSYPVFLLQEIWATNTRHWWDKPALSQDKPKISTERVALCC
jgi:glycerol kinase